MRALDFTRDVADLLNAQASSGFPGVEFATWFPQGEKVVPPETSPEIVRAFGKVLYGPENVRPASQRDPGPTAPIEAYREPFSEAVYTIEVYLAGEATDSLYRPILDAARLTLTRSGVFFHAFEGPSASDLSESLHAGFSVVAMTFESSNG